MEYKKYDLHAGLNEDIFINDQKHKNVIIYWKFFSASYYIKTEICTYNNHNNSCKILRKYEGSHHYRVTNKSLFSELIKCEDSNCNDVWEYKYNETIGKIIKLNFFVPEDCVVEIYLIPIN